MFLLIELLHAMFVNTNSYYFFIKRLFTAFVFQIGRGRLVQSVGTPYGGTPAAGGIATVARFFGVGCGSNSDLIPSGARSWQSGISDFTRQNVFYYTTQVGHNEGIVLLSTMHIFWTFGVMIGLYVLL